MDSERERVSHRIDMLCLAALVRIILMQFMSTLSCLIRSDFNFPVIFFCYYTWQNRKDRISLNLVNATSHVDYSLTHCPHDLRSNFLVARRQNVGKAGRCQSDLESSVGHS